MGDTARLQQVGAQLVSNAREFTAHGEVKLMVEVVGADQVTVSIHDTGLGVAMGRNRSKYLMSSASQSAQYPAICGLGIGLAICRQLIDMHGGKIGGPSGGDEK